MTDADLVGCDGKTLETEQPDLRGCMDYCFSLRTCFTATFDGKKCYPKLENGYTIARAPAGISSVFYTGPTETVYAPKPSGCVRPANYFKF